jgi:hypothetical protein
LIYKVTVHGVVDPESSAQTETDGIAPNTIVKEILESVKGASVLPMDKCWTRCRQSRNSVIVADSRFFDERRRGSVFQVGGDGGDEPLEGRSVLQAAGFRHRQHALDETTATFTLGPE